MGQGSEEYRASGDAPTRGSGTARWDGGLAALGWSRHRHRRDALAAEVAELRLDLTESCSKSQHPATAIELRIDGYRPV